MTDTAKPRTKDPSYHVFKLTSVAGQRDAAHWRQLTDKDNPARAKSRQAAIESVAGEPRELQEGEAPDVYFVVHADELKTFSPRVKVERSVSWEALPEPPPALTPRAPNGAAAAKGGDGDAADS